MFLSVVCHEHKCVIQCHRSDVRRTYIQRNDRATGSKIHGSNPGKGKGKVTFTLKQATKTQKGSRGTAVVNFMFC